MTEVDQYIEDVVRRGDEGSALLAARCASTLRNSEHIQILREGMNGIAVLRVPEDHAVIVHGASGDTDVLDPYRHVTSMIGRLMTQAKLLDAIPLGLADVIDASTGDRGTIEAAADALVSGANNYGFSVMNGELAILGSRINCAANVSGTMISVRKNGPLSGVHELPDGTEFAAFRPNGKAVYMNSDGVGTKTEFYERARRYSRALRDSLAMKLDDAIKIGADAKVVFDFVETRGNVPMEFLMDEAFELSDSMGFYYLLHHQPVGNRLTACLPYLNSYNVSGSVVSTIDEERLQNPPTPRDGDCVLAIRGRPNPRSNGITDKRKAMVKRFGERWHETAEGQYFLEFLAEPSTVFYPVFRELMRSGAATSVYHMSGGAYNGKLARPLAKHGFYTRLEGLFDPDPRELALGMFLSTPPEMAYAKWPMGNEGFATTPDPEKAMHVIGKYGLESRQVGRLERHTNKTGVELAGIKGSDRKDVYFPGK